MTLDLPQCALIRITGSKAWSQGTNTSIELIICLWCLFFTMNAAVDDLQDAVARAVTTALRNIGYAVDSDDDEADSTRCVV